MPHGRTRAYYSGTLGATKASKCSGGALDLRDLLTRYWPLDSLDILIGDATVYWWTSSPILDLLSRLSRYWWAFWLVGPPELLDPLTVIALRGMRREISAHALIACCQRYHDEWFNFSVGVWESLILIVRVIAICPALRNLSKLWQSLVLPIRD